MKLIKRVLGVLVDYPTVANVLVLTLVGVHLLTTQWHPDWNIAVRLVEASTESKTLSDLTSLALGAATIAAMVGGFAGVVVIFGLGAENDRFRILRQKGGRRLRASWVSVVLVSFVAAFGSVSAAIVVVAFNAVVGMWIFEATLLLSAHAAVRLTWLLGRLARLVDASDKDAETQSKRVSAESMFKD